ncbi:MAG TPA: glycosyltransferase, partial [Streptosporangiaceae bacterium]|nr:glycosyltransferase [Streptosporangiaceae bacterium]
MLETLLLAAIVAAPVGSASLFLPAGHRARRAGAWSATRRFVLAVVGTVLLAAVVAGALKLLGVAPHYLTAGIAGVVIASLVWLPVTRRWNARAHLAWASTVFLFVVYLAYALEWTFNSHLGAASTAGGLLLWVFEVFAAVLCCAYLWEICDALGTEHWRRRVTPQVTFGTEDGKLPMVSLHVPAHNEPPDMVIDTLRALMRLDYPRYEVICIDDNTDDEQLWRPVQRWCASHGVKFEHLSNWPGYKSGALNYALRNMTDPGAGIIGVVDSDYQIEPGFLRRCAPAFASSWIGFVQSPQDYRGWQDAPYYRRLYYSYKYFFAVSQPARNEHDGAIFAGTMGLIRRVALEQLGGWDEWCITEDAELSLRLLRAGWHGLHVDQSWGYGIMPLTFEALKGQRYRWCFGGIQILRMHWRSLIPGRDTKANHLNSAQRWSYLAGGIQWYGDLLGLIFFVFLLAGAFNLATGGGELFRKLTVFLVAAVPVMVGLGLVRAITLLRRGTGASWRDAIGAFFIWQSTSVVVARASVLGLFAKKAAFLRTPKTSERAKWWEALRANWAESSLALLGLAGIVGALTKWNQLSGPLLAALLLFPTLGFAAAPFNSWAAQRATLPAWLRERRRTENRRDRRAFAAGAATGGAVVVAGVVEGAGVDVVAGGDWTGPTRLGPVPRRPVSMSTIASAATVVTATALPVASPAAKARRSRRYSVRRRSRSQAGSAARRAAQLLNGAAAMPSVGTNSKQASSGPLRVLVLVSAPAIPAAPKSARTVSAQLARSACSQLVRSLVFGVRRKAAFFANSASTEARATTREVDCQMKNAPSASRQVAPVLRRTSAIARIRPRRMRMGTVATRNTVSLRNSWPPPVAMFTA